MNYIYDIYLNFNKNLYDFFDWNKNDNLIHIKSIPIFKLSEENFKTLVTHNIKLSDIFLKNIYNKASVFGKDNIHKNYALFCDENNIIGIEFDDYGTSVNKSQLLITEELEILETTHKLKIKNFNFDILNKVKTTFKTRKQLKEENFIKNELKNIEEKKLNYICFECFGKQENNKKKIINKLLNLSKNSKTYKKLYNILKLTATSNK